MATEEQNGRIAGKLQMARECRALLIPEEEGGFSIICTSLPGVASQGETEAEAISHLKEAFQGAIQSYHDLQVPIPWHTGGVEERPANAKEIWVVIDA